MVYASQEMYESLPYQYAYPAAYPVYEQEATNTSGWSNVAMFAVAGALVGGALGYNTKQKRAGATRAGTPEMKAALLYSTSTGNTETAAGYIAAATGLEAVDIGDVDVETIKACDSLIVGAPTWHTGADSERSGTAWDEFLYGDLTGLDLSGKKVAIFGMGDQSGYADNYCDAMDELASCFEKQGATIVGAWSTDGYEHEDSKSVRGPTWSPRARSRPSTTRPRSSRPASRSKKPARPWRRSSYPRTRTGHPYRRSPPSSRSGRGP